MLFCWQPEWQPSKWQPRSQVKIRYLRANPKWRPRVNQWVMFYSGNQVKSVKTNPNLLPPVLLRTYFIFDRFINLFDTMSGFRALQLTTFTLFSCLVLSGSDVSNCQHSADGVSSKI